jgi:hypothetical protein
MELSPTANRLVQAQAHAEADPRVTSLRLWRDGVEVEMWEGGRRIARRVTWADIETAHANPIILVIDACASKMATNK